MTSAAFVCFAPMGKRFLSQNRVFERKLRKTISRSAPSLPFIRHANEESNSKLGICSATPNGRNTQMASLL